MLCTCPLIHSRSLSPTLQAGRPLSHLTVVYGSLSGKACPSLTELGCKDHSISMFAVPPPCPGGLVV